RRHTRFSRDWSSDVCSSDLCMKGIDIFNLSPYQIILFEKEDRTEYSLVLNFHHIIFDWDSIHILHEQLLEIFQNITEPNSKLTRSEERRVGKEGRFK